MFANRNENWSEDMKIFKIITFKTGNLLITGNEIDTFRILIVVILTGFPFILSNDYCKIYTWNEN